MTPWQSAGMASRVGRSAARGAERSLVATRAVISRFLDSVQLRLRAIDVSRDPAIQAWIHEMRQMDKAEVERRVASQPEPWVLIDRRRASTA